MANEKELNNDDLSNIEVTFTPETNKKIDQLDEISLQGLDTSKEQKIVNQSLEKDLLEITNIQKEQLSQNQEILKTIENLNNLVNAKKDETVVEPLADPVVTALNDLKLENKDNNLQLIKEIQKTETQQVAVEKENVDLTPLLSKFDDLNESILKLNQTNTTVVNNTENKEALSNIVTENKNTNQELLNQITLGNQNTITEIQNLQKENVSNLTENNTKSETALKTIVDASKVNNTTNQTFVTEETKNFQNTLDKIEVQNNAKAEQNTEFINKLEEIKTSNENNLTTINNENKKLVNNQNEIVNTTLENLNTVKEDQNKTNSQLVEKINNLTVVQNDKNEKTVEQTNTEKLLENNKESFNQLQEKISNISSNTNTTTTTTPTLVTAEKEDPNNKIIEYLDYSVQLQSGMIDLLQQLVDAQNVRRYSDTPIKN